MDRGIGEARRAVLRAAFEPDALPPRVAAAATIAVAGEGSAAAAEFDRWGARPATGMKAATVADLASAALTGEWNPDLIERVRVGYGRPGVVAAAGIAAAYWVYDGPFKRSSGSAGGIPAPPLTGDLTETASKIRRSFGRIPSAWAVIAHEPRSFSRWWALHEAVMEPGALTGQEKWMLAIAAAGAVRTEVLAEPYRALLDASHGRGAVPLGRRAVVGVREPFEHWLGGKTDADRFALQSAALPAIAVTELESVGLLIGALSIFARLTAKR